MRIVERLAPKGRSRIQLRCTAYATTSRTCASVSPPLRRRPKRSRWWPNTSARANSRTRPSPRCVCLGRAFPAFDERTLQIGGSLLWKLVGELTGARTAALTAAYRKRGDLGAAAYDVLLANAPATATITLQEVRNIFDQIAATRTAAAKAAVLESLLERATALEAKYILKIITGELRIGLEREPGRRGHRQSLRRTGGNGAARQHAAGRYRWDAAAGRGASPR